jgi:hypothetical protein
MSENHPFWNGQLSPPIRDKYFEYDGEKYFLDKGLTIGGYESAWLADLVAAYVLEKTKHLFLGTVFYGIYRDDGLVIFLGILLKAEIALWPITSSNK